MIRRCKPDKKNNCCNKVLVCLPNSCRNVHTIFTSGRRRCLLGPNFFERTLEKISIRSLPFGSVALVGDRDRSQTVNALDSRTLV